MSSDFCPNANSLLPLTIRSPKTKEFRMTGCLDYRLSRRAAMAATGASILGMSVPNLLAAAGKDHAAKAEHVILFWNGGGMSHIDTWDPKPGRPTGGELAPIKTSADGVQISELFPQLAKQ